MVIEIESVDEGKSLEEIIDELARAIVVKEPRVSRFKKLLMEFAEEIKRQAIEP